MKRVLLIVIRWYQRHISPYKPGGRTCRFYPTCSEYAAQAIEKYGVLRGVVMAGKRILKCHPFHPGGYDPVK